MAARVFFHVGAPKTGTTFLQTVMWDSRAELEAQGVRYPGEKRMDQFHATRSIRDAPDDRRDSGAKAWDRLVRELAEWPGTGLLSHEFFSLATAEQAERAMARLAPAEVHVVLTARDYVRQFPAVWQEALKMNSDLSFDEFMDRAMRDELPGAWSWATQDIVAVLERWGATLPPERVHVVTVPRPGGARDLLWRRWCSVVGLEAGRFDLDAARTNESLGAPQAALLHRIKPYLSEPLDDGTERHRWFRQYLAHEVLVAQAGPRFGLRPAHAAELARRSAEAAEAIGKAGYAVTGDLEELVPQPVGPDIRPHPDDVSDAELVQVAARAIEQMVRDVRELALERNQWRRQALEPPGKRAARFVRRLGSRAAAAVRARRRPR